jgi:steroid 5-alpha reductase family enzyme
MLSEALIITGGTIFIFVTFLFALSVMVRRNDIADIAWGVGVLLVGLIPASYYGTSGVPLLVLFLATLWGTRLALRIFLRNIRKSEDVRYKTWRDSWGKWFYLRSYLQVYLLQGFLMLVVGYPLMHAVLFGDGLTVGILTLIGVCVWLIGFFFEVVGDYQLDRYIRSEPKPSPILQSGLWKYTRHPNYFGEVTMWWGVWLMVAAAPMSYLALIGPLTITFLILKVSGIPMLEKRFDGNPDFEAYKKRTSAFLPLPPRSLT